MAGNELKITISAQDNASQVFKKIGDAATKVADGLEKAGKDGGKGFDEVAKGADKASASFAKLDSSGNGAIRVVGEAGSAASETGDAFIQMGTGLSTVANQFAEWSQSARDQQQVLIGIRAAFGDTADEMLSFGQTLSDSNKTIFNDDDILRGERYFATLKNNYDLTTQQIKDLMQTTADLATASGVSFEDASSRVTSAIRGEGEAAEYLGLTMNQQSIDRENLTLTMSNQEAAQFRLNALNQQAAAYSGTAAQVAQSSVGTYAAVTNQLQDMGQAVGGVVGPWASFASTMGNGLATVGEATRGVTEIKAGLTGLVGVVRSSSLAMSALSLATGPVGLAIAGIGLALAGAAYLWKQHNKDAEEAKKAMEEYGRAVVTVDNAIDQQRLLGDTSLANRMEQESNAIRNAMEQGVNNIDHLKDEMSKAWDSLDEEITNSDDVYGTMTKFFNDGMGRAALDFAQKSGAITKEVYDQILGGNYLRDNSQQYIGEMRKIWDGYVDALQISSEDKTKVEGNINELFKLMANPNIDQAKLAEGIKPIMELLDAGKVDEANAAFATFFATIIAGAGTAAPAINKLTYGLDGQIQILDSQAEKIKQIYKDIYEARTGEAYPEERITESDVYAEQDIDKRAALAAQLKEQRRQDMADEEQFYREQEAHRKQRRDADRQDAQDDRDRQQKRYEERKKQNDDFLAMQRAAMEQDERDRESDRQRRHDDAQKESEAQKAIFEARAQAAKDTISSFMEATGNDDFVSQLNLAGLGNEYTQLAGDITDAGTAIDTVFRVIVGNTNAIKSQAEGVKSWADELINVRGELGRIDELMSTDTSVNPYGEALLSPEQYEAAQQAYDSIAESTAKIGVNVDAIQAMQAGFIAGFLEDQNALLESLRQVPEEQQRVTLGWMDQTSAMQANQAVAMASAAANGELGASGKAATQEFIEGLIATNPYMMDMLESIGLITVATDKFGNKTFSVNFEGAASTIATLDDLNSSLLVIADLLDNGQLDGSINISIKGIEEAEAARAELEAFQDKTVTVTIETSGATTDSDRRTSGIDGPFDASLAPPVVIPTEYATPPPLELPKPDPVTILVNAKDNASSVIDGAQGKANTFGQTDASASLAAEDNASDTIKGVIGLMESFTSKTVSLNVVTNYSSTGSPSNFSGGSGLAERHGGILGYAHGGVLFEAGEAGPEIAHFAGGGMAVLPTHDYYVAPAGTRIEPANSAASKLGGSPSVVININAPVFGLDDLKADIGVAVAQAWMAEQQRYRREQGVAA